MRLQHAIGLIVSFGVVTAAGPTFGATLVGVGVDESSGLYDVDPGSGQLTNRRPVGTGRFSGVTYVPGEGLYGISNQTSLEVNPFPNSLLRIDLTTGAATVVGPVGFAVSEGDIAFDARTGGIIAANAGGELYRVDRRTGIGNAIGAVLPPPWPNVDQSIDGLAFSPAGDLYALDTRPLVDRLLRIDPDSGGVISITNITGPNLSNSTLGMAFNPDSGVLYVAEGHAAGSTDAVHLYTLDTLTGALSLVGTMNAADGLSGLAFVPEPSVAGLFLFGAGAAALRRGDRRR